MPEIFIYLVKANLAIILFYLGYRFLLRKLTFYHLNRFYLLFALLFSALYPLVDLQSLFANRQVAVVSEVVYVLPEWDVTVANEVDPWSYISMVVWAVAAFLGVRFFVRLFSLLNIHRQSTPAQWRLFRYRQVFRSVNPFSFWRTIYLNPQQHGELELEDIFHHEQVHVDELHTLDILLVEVCSVLCWFNPGAWLMRHAVRENLEFITDRRVLQSGMDKKAYQYSLLKACTMQYRLALGANFNVKSIKRRIAMMNSGRSSRLHLGKYVVVVPAIALFVLIFTITNARQEGGSIEPIGEILGTLTAGITRNEAVLGDVFVADSANSSTSDVAIEIREESPTGGTISDTRVIRGEVIRQNRGDTIRVVGTGNERSTSTVVGRRVSFMPVLSDSTAGKPLLVVDGVEVRGREISTLDPDRIHSINVLKGNSATALFGDRGEFGAILVTTKGKENRVAFGLEDDANESSSSQRAIKGHGRIVRTAGIDSTLTLHIADRAFANVGEEDSKMSEIVVVGRPMANVRTDTPDFRNALIIIDGESASAARLQGLSPNEIKALTVLKGETAIEKYGTTGKNGAIEVELVN